MPLHRIYHPSNLFTLESERSNFAKAITEIYASPPANLPRFYVVVLFIPLEPSRIFTGGEQRKDFVRITVEHIAIQLPEDLSKMDRFMKRYEDVLAPFIKEKGLDWEVSVSATPRELWHENGINPPDVGSDAHLLWVKENRPVPLSRF